MIIVPVINTLTTFGDALPLTLGAALIAIGSLILGYLLRVRRERYVRRQARREGIRIARDQRIAENRAFAASLPGTPAETTLSFERIGVES